MCLIKYWYARWDVWEPLPYRIFLQQRDREGEISQQSLKRRPEAKRKYEHIIVSAFKVLATFKFINSLNANLVPLEWHDALRENVIIAQNWEFAL
jgi:hypothetical protein